MTTPISSLHHYFHSRNWLLERGRMNWKRKIVYWREDEGKRKKNLANENVFPLSFILLFTHTQKDSSRNCKQFFHMSQGNKYLWEMDIINLPSESAHFARYWLHALLIYRSLLPTRVKVSSEVFLSVLQMPIKSTLWTGIKCKKK